MKRFPQATLLVFLLATGCAPSRQEVAMRECLKLMETICAAIEGIHDVVSASAANAALERATRSFAPLVVEVKQLGEPPDALMRKLGPKLRSAAQRLQKAGEALQERVRADAQIGVALLPAMLKIQQIGAKMQAAAPSR